MKSFAIFLILGACVLAALAWPQTSRAQVLFQTTFNCPDWDQSMGLGEGNVCNSGDGIAGNGAWTTSGHPAGDQITAAANNPNGGGFKGFRHWVGNGTNNAGGGIRVQWSGRSELWFRYFVRFQLGFSWGSPIEMKTIYVNYGQNGTFYWGLKDSRFGGHVEVDQLSRSGAAQGNLWTSKTWSDWQGGSTGDGKFHCVELHVIMNSGGGQNGTLEAWLDGAKVGSWTDVRFSSTNASFNESKVGENHNNPQSGSSADQFVDFDDIVISATGPIGCGLLAPNNLRVQ